MKHLRIPTAVVLALICLLWPAVPALASTAPDPATNVTVARNTNGTKVKVTWKGGANATHFLVAADNSDGRWLPVGWRLRNVSASRQFLWFRADPGRDYRVAVLAIAGVHTNRSDWSDKVKSPQAKSPLVHAGAGNLDQAEDGTCHVSTVTACAAAFETEEHKSGFKLTAVKVKFDKAEGTPAFLQVKLYDATGAVNPGTALTTLTPATVGHVHGGWHLFVCTADCDLEPASTYFVAAVVNPQASNVSGDTNRFAWRTTNASDDYAWPDANALYTWNIGDGLWTLNEEGSNANQWQAATGAAPLIEVAAAAESTQPRKRPQSSEIPLAQ